MRKTLTALIPAHNEEINIERCVKSVLWCDKVQVICTGTDKTVELARKLGADVVIMNQAEKSDFVSVQKNINWAIDHAATDWILRIDADEVVTDELKKEIEHILSEGKDIEKEDPVAYGIPRKQYFWGGFLKGGDWAYDRLVRLFRPSKARYEPIVPVHEQFKVNGKIGYLKNALLHYSHPDLKTAIHKFDIYTSVEIHGLHDSIPQAIFKMIFMPPYIFLRWMIWHHGYRDGLRGIVAGLFRAWYDFMLYSKYISYKK